MSDLVLFSSLLLIKALHLQLFYFDYLRANSIVPLWKTISRESHREIYENRQPHKKHDFPLTPLTATFRNDFQTTRL